MSSTRRIGSVARTAVTAASVVIAGVSLVGIGAALATPPQGAVTRTELAKGRTTGPVNIQTSGPADFYVQQVTVEVGASSGWHHHPGPEYTAIKSGSGTLYRGGCEPVTVSAGQAMFIPGGMNHLVRNDGDAPLELYVTYTIPADTAVRADEPAPADCTVS